MPNPKNQFFLNVHNKYILTYLSNFDGQTFYILGRFVIKNVTLNVKLPILNKKLTIFLSYLLEMK